MKQRRNTRAEGSGRGGGVYGRGASDVRGASEYGGVETGCCGGYVAGGVVTGYVAGGVVTAELAKERVIDWIELVAKKTSITASVLVLL